MANNEMQIMKKSILFLLFITIPILLNAQSKNSLVYGYAVAKYEKMEKTGTVLTIVGGVALFTGNILYWKTYNDQSDGEPSGDKARKYGRIMIGGLGLMTIGIPLWAIGKSKERHIQIEAELVNFKGLASANGVGVKIRF
jgi:Trk-type K+ transport system membrane component